MSHKSPASRIGNLPSSYLLAILAAVGLVSLHELSALTMATPLGTAGMLATGLVLLAWGGVAGLVSRSARQALFLSVTPSVLLAALMVVSGMIHIAAPPEVVLGAFLLAGVTDGISYAPGASTSLLPYELAICVALGILSAVIGHAVNLLRTNSATH